MIDRIESCIARIENCGNTAAREAARELAESILDLHRKGLRSILDALSSQGRTDLIDAIAGDTLVSQLMLLHGLHPRSLEARVSDALGRVAPQLAAHGGSVRLVEIREGRIRLELKGSCGGCPSAAATLNGAIESAILEAAPDAGEIEIV